MNFVSCYKFELLSMIYDLPFEAMNKG